MLYHHVITNPDATEWVVFIHGAGGSSNVWFKQLRSFKKVYNLLLIDLRGHGKSVSDRKRKEVRHYTFREIALDVIEVLDHMKLAASHFIGVSLGTIIIREIAEVDRRRVCSMIMAGAVVKFNFRSKLLLNAANVGKYVVPYTWLYPLFARILMPRSCHKNSRNLFIREAMKVTSTEFLNWMSLCSNLNSFLELFWGKELPIPTIYIMGEYDYIFLSQVKLLLNYHTKYSKLAVIPGSGHVCTVDDCETFNELSLNFLFSQRAIAG